MKHMIWISLILALIMSQIALAFYKTSNDLNDKGNTKKKGTKVKGGFKPSFGAIR